MHESANGLSRASVGELASRLASDDGVKRMHASEELFRRGVSVRAELVNLGAKPVVGLAPSRLDAVYTLLSGVRVARHAKDSFGVLVAWGTSEQDIADLCARRGLRRDATDAFGTDKHPNCYLHIVSGRPLEDVMVDVLMREPTVVSVTYNFVD